MMAFSGDSRTMDPSLPLVPHRPPMLLIDRVRAADATRCRTVTRVDPGAWYADADGAMPGWFGLELMAQSVAAFSGSRGRELGTAPKFGYLLGTRQYTCAVPAFPAGAELEVQVEVEYADAMGLSAFTCELSSAGAVLARAVLTVYEAES